MPSNIQSLKSANLVRVDVGKSENLYAASRELGEPMMCPASAQKLQHDIYGRPASQNTLNIMTDASCGSLSSMNAERHIQRENNERPYLPICSAGMRGVGDLMGMGRDLTPQNLYGEGHRGDFVRHYNTRNNAPWDPAVEHFKYYNRIEQPSSLSMDSTKSAYWHN